MRCTWKARRHQWSPMWLRQTNRFSSGPRTEIGCYCVACGATKVRQPAGLWTSAQLGISVRDEWWLK